MGLFFSKTAVSVVAARIVITTKDANSGTVGEVFCGCIVGGAEAEAEAVGVFDG